MTSLSPYLLQFSSLGSLDEKWMVELASSMSAGLSEDKVPLGMGEPQIIWPTVEDVRCSIEVSILVLMMLFYILKEENYFWFAFHGHFKGYVSHFTACV